MPHLTLAASPDGLAVEALIGLDGSTMAGLRAAGTPIPAPITLRALLDTGSDVTAVDPRVLGQLGASSIGSASTHTAAGKQTVRLFKVSLSISGPAGPAGPILVRPTLVVTELSQSLPNVEALIGRDVLDDCPLVNDGPGRQFILGF
jgi:hypothetical protein